MAQKQTVPIRASAHGKTLGNTAMKKAAGITQPQMVVMPSQNAHGMVMDHTVMSKVAGTIMIILIALEMITVSGIMTLDGAAKQDAGITLIQQTALIIAAYGIAPGATVMSRVVGTTIMKMTVPQIAVIGTLTAVDGAMKRAVGIIGIIQVA